MFLSNKQKAINEADNDSNLTNETKKHISLSTQETLPEEPTKDRFRKSRMSYNSVEIFKQRKEAIRNKNLKEFANLTKEFRKKNLFT